MFRERYVPRHGAVPAAPPALSGAPPCCARTQTLGRSARSAGRCTKTMFRERYVPRHGAVPAAPPALSGAPPCCARTQTLGR